MVGTAGQGRLLEQMGREKVKLLSALCVWGGLLAVPVPIPLLTMHGGGRGGGQVSPAKKLHFPNSLG